MVGGPRGVGARRRLPRGSHAARRGLSAQGAVRGRGHRPDRAAPAPAPRGRPGSPGRLEALLASAVPDEVPQPRLRLVEDLLHPAAIGVLAIQAHELLRARNAVEEPAAIAEEVLHAVSVLDARDLL